MKKFLFFAAALLCLVACNQKEEVVAPLEPGKTCTLTATISLNDNQSVAARKITPGAIAGGKLSFKWQEGDSVVISNASGSQKFGVIVGTISADGKTANFEGTALTDMSSYTVTYGNASATEVTYQEGSFTPIASGTGANNKFELDSYNPVLELKLTGATTVTAIKYFVNGELKTTLNCGEGIALTSTAKTVYFPLMSEAEAKKAKLEFYNGNNLILVQYLPCAVAKSDYIQFPTLNVAYPKYICFETTSGSGTVAINSGRYKYPNLQYTTTPADPTTWATFDVAADEQTISADSKLYVRAGTTPNAHLSDILSIPGYGDFWYDTPLFVTTGNVKVSGNIMALLNQEPATELIDDNNNAFKSTFSGTTIVDASELIMPTKVCSNAFWETFASCSQLVAPPALPAMTLDHHCYTAMFDNCTSLTATPELPATTLAYECYHAMFRGCTALTAVPELPATQLDEYCYQSMFNGCTGLTSVPTDLLKNNLTLAHSCYASMFAGCTNLTNTPDLPATTLAPSCYSSMFNGCSSLTTAPVLPAETLKMGCYRSMFESCSKLQSVTMLATAGYDWDTGGDGLCKWLLYAGTSASSPTIYVASDAAKTAIEAWSYEETPAKPANWTIVVKP